MFCFRCGKEIEDNARFCFYCGQNVAKIAAEFQPDEEPADNPAVEQPEPDCADVLEPTVVVACPAAPTQPATSTEVPTYETVPHDSTPPRSKRKKVWTAVALTAVILVGILGGCLWMLAPTHEDALNALTKVAFIGDFSQIEDLAPEEYWERENLSVEELKALSSVWKCEILPGYLQKKNGDPWNVQYTSFTMPRTCEIAVEREPGLDEELLERFLQRNYGIPAKKVKSVRKLEVKFVFYGNRTDGTKEELMEYHTVFAVRIGFSWYIMNREGDFAVDRIVEDLEEYNSKR